MIRAAATQNVPGEQVGPLNHIFAYVYRVRALGLRIKEWHQPVYCALKWSLLAAIGYAIVVGFYNNIDFMPPASCRVFAQHTKVSTAIISSAAVIPGIPTR